MSIRENVNLLRQFYQIILYGPPGTGKTYTAKKMLAELFGANSDDSPKFQGEHWDIVQFHPSYNYEDFVRGVQVKAVGNQIAYNTENRTFGEMCKRAGEALERADGDVGRADKYALIIDEINRANVSAVLGELIYALEPDYRGESVKTPYSVDGDQNITIPKNLYIIGTMNTADRTIGQIDYAVRRRFAFVHCPPNSEVIENAAARDFFQRVDAVFNEHLSPDFDADDVRIGHSYFMADGEKLANKIIWQVCPILREYVKDGVLKKEAESDIAEVEDAAKKLQAGESGVADLPAGSGYYCVNTGKTSRRGTTERFRDWEYCRKFGFLAAGGMSEKRRRFASNLRKIKTGDKVFAFLKDDENNKGLVGFGEVAAAAVPVRDFQIEGVAVLDYKIDGQSVREKYPKLAETADNPDECEYFLRVNWIKDYSAEDAKPWKGKRSVAYRITDKDTVAEMKKCLEVE